ncbi:tyrosine-type recombinase/integrase [Marinobacter suaedae]|uniref:tyrosine-type recombinase/integrase n=1 Tax=Marinobacter suaedae TaxID=3057675 RepID=UPI003B968B78
MVQELVQTEFPYVYLRRKTYYFRFVIPPRIRQLCPSLPREVKRSLRTDSLTDAWSMVSDKLPLIRLLRLCNSAEVARDLCQRLSDFACQIGEWVRAKVAALRPMPVEPRASVDNLKTSPNAPMLDEAWEQFCLWKSWTEKRTKLNQRMYANLRYFLGNVSVASIRKQDIKGALERISRLPKGNLRAYKGESLKRLCSLSVPPQDRVSAKYVKEHLKLCQSLFSRYLKQELDVLETSPTEGLRWAHEDNRYGCLTDAQVRALLAQMEDKPEWFRWFLLMALYSGARRSELASLTKADIKRCPDTGRHYFVVKDGKTRAARRAVPIHSRLLQEGFLTWVAVQEGRLFETAFHNPNRVTDLFGSMLNAKTNDHGERLVFHSVRHTFITSARAAGNDTVLVQQVVGHEKRGAGQTDRYTHTFPLKDILSVVDCICYGSG